ncbi:MAG: hypothetical protein ACOXZT_00900 [Tissierellaceae bacterium]|jgi:hypothetical protein|nr:hypothetical protein [Tissierellia bacterium]
MKILKRVLIAISIVVLTTILVFISQLFLDAEKIRLTYYVLPITCLFIALYGLFQLITGKSISKSYRGTSGTYRTRVVVNVDGENATAISGNCKI